MERDFLILSTAEIMLLVGLPFEALIETACMLGMAMDR